MNRSRQNNPNDPLLQQRPKPSSAKTTPMHDDSDAGRLIPVNQPALAIDYLGNSWKNEDDIAASWKFMTKQKNDLINGLRLENASWRNWAKQRHNLKTISPKVLNWLKDSDTTWLYGPLYKAAIDEFDLNRFGTSSSSSSLLTPGTDSSSSGPTTPPAIITTTNDGTSSAVSTIKPKLKPALKHKTASQLFKADTLFHVQSDLKLKRRFGAQNKAHESAIIKELRQPKLRFNDSVEQCVAIDTDAILEEEEEEDEGTERLRNKDDEGDDDEERAGLNGRHEDEDGGILMRISTRKPPRSIVRIDPTKLKAASFYGMDEYNDEDELEDATDDDDDDDDDVEPIKDTEEEYNDEEDGLFDEPIYLGNPYTDAESAGYMDPHSYGYHESANGPTSNYFPQGQDVDMAEVSYTRPTQPAAAASASSTSTSTSSSAALPNSAQQIFSGQGLVATAAAAPAAAATTIATTTTAVTTTTAPMSSSSSSSSASAPTKALSELEAEKALLAANPGGFQQRAVDLVANVKDLVSWASSFVYNSSTF
ncbi:hypothetical protein BGX28_000781 [Mortierella sp. GBA30]|nr:hypothetical protein BGX28_000781 [Mortierella sp. GBA30]